MESQHVPTGNPAAAPIALLRRHPLITFFTLAYAISWATFYLLDGPVIFTIGPFLAAILTALIADGMGGLRDVARRILRWRVQRIWLAAAFVVPVAMGLAVAALTTVVRGAPMPVLERLGPWYSPLLLFAMLLFTADTLFEETGWRAFAMPRFPADRSPLANTLVLGVLLAGWHLPVALSEPGALGPYLVATIASAVVTNWIYYSGRESAFLAWMYHTAANTAGQSFMPLFGGESRVTYFWVLAGVNVGVAAAIVLVNGRALRAR